MQRQLQAKAASENGAHVAIHNAYHIRANSIVEKVSTNTMTNEKKMARQVETCLVN